MALNAEIYLHDSDRAAMAALKAIPGFSQFTKAFMKIWSERQFRIVNMSSNLRLGEGQMEKYYNRLPPICEKLGIEVPGLFVKLDVSPNAYTYGDTKPFIVVTSGLLETMPDELISTVLAHECGHIACRHTLYTTMGSMILGGAASFVTGLGNLALYPLQLAFSYWMRCSEFSADRAAVICDGSAEKTVEIMMRFAGCDKDIAAQASVERFMEQAVEYREMIQDNTWDKTLEFLYSKDLDHPLNTVRAYEAREWGESERFGDIMEYFNADPAEAEDKLPVEVPITRMVGKNAADMQAKLLMMGFTNVRTVRNTEAGKTKEGGVVSLTIGGAAKDGWYNRGDEAVIEYFEAKTQAEIALEHPGEIKLPEAQKHYTGMTAEEAKTELEHLGFTRFVIKEMAMSKIGWGEKEGSVAKIMVNEQTQLEKGAWVPEDSEMVLYIYTRV